MTTTNESETIMATAAKWKHFGTKVNPKNNAYSSIYKNFRHQGTLESVQVQDVLDVTVAYDEPIEEFILYIRECSKALIEPTITQSSYVQNEDGYDGYSETESTIKGWRAELTEPEKKAVSEWFEGLYIVE